MWFRNHKNHVRYFEKWFAPRVISGFWYKLGLDKEGGAYIISVQEGLIKDGA